VGGVGGVGGGGVYLTCYVRACASFGVL